MSNLKRSISLILVYFIVGKVSLFFASPLLFISPIWLVSGIALAAVILFGYKMLPSIFISSFLLNISVMMDVSNEFSLFELTAIASLISLGAVLQSAIGLFLINRTIKLPTIFEQGQDFGYLMFFGGIVACTIGATFGALTLIINELIIVDTYLVTFLRWWASNMAGIVLCTPVVLIIFSGDSACVRKLPIVMSLTVISILTIGIFSYSVNIEKNETEHLFQEFTLEKSNLIEKRLTISMEVLKSIEQFYKSSKLVDRTEFRTFASYALENYSVIKALEWIPRVSFSDKEKYEKLAAEDGYTDFRIFEKDGESLIPVRERSEYYPVFYVEPYLPNKKAFGFDLASNKERLMALESAGDTGKQYATSRINLVQETGDKYGFLIFNPVYENSKDINSLEDRRKFLKGFILGVFSVEDLVKSAFDINDAYYANIHVYEQGTGSNNVTLYGKEVSGYPFTSSVRIEVAGREWKLDYTPTELFITNNSSLKSLIVLLVSLFICFFVILFLLTSTARTEIIKRLVKQKTIALQESEGRMRSVMDNVVEGLITITTDGIIESYNHSCEDMFGYKVDEVIGKNVKILMPTEYAINHDEHLRKYNYGGNAKILGISREVEGRHKDGTVFPMDLSVNQITLPDGRKLFSGIVRDITERKDAEDKLQEYAGDLEFQKFALEEAKLKADSMAALPTYNPNPLLKMGIDGEILLVNKAMDEILGGVENYNINHPFLEGIVENSRIDENVLREVEYNDVVYLQTIVRAKVGEREEVLVYYSDVTPIRKAQEKAEESTRLKSDFLATMSHEIRTPMNGIFGMAELVLETELTNKQRSHINTLMNSADSLLILIDDILDFSKIEAGKLELDPMPFSLRSVNENIVELLSIKAMHKSIEIITRYVPGTPEYLIGDSGRIRQIINNLVGNAIKFTDMGYVLVTLEQYTPEIAEEGKVGIKISVTDTGIGIPDEMQGIIFDKFSQADTSTTRKFGGTGLGLAICKQLANMMGGTVGIESKMGEGSTFWFTMLLEEDLEHRDEEISNHSDLSLLKGERVLILDNLDINCRIMEEELGSVGMDCNSFLSPYEALDAVYKAQEDGIPFKIMLTDYHMVGMNGIELANKIKGDKNISDIMLIMVSSTYKSGADDKELDQYGFSSYIYKPVKSSSFKFIIADTWNLYKNGECDSISNKSNLDNKLEKEQNIKFQDVNILLAEDNHVNQDFAVQILSNLGCDVDLAENGKEAVELAKDNKYDIIFMDCQMPVMDGYEASECIGDMQSKGKIDITPIVALTANAMKGDRENCISHGMHDYIAKPVRKATLVEVLTKWLPEKVINVSEEDNSNASYAIEGGIYSNKEILLVEDNLTNRIVAAEMLKSFGCNITEVGNGQEAVDIVKEHKFDLIFMDCQMPIMDGYEASIIINEMKSRNEISDIPIVALTGNYSRKDKEKCLGLGMNDYAVKPVKKQILNDMLEKWLLNDKKYENNVCSISSIDSATLEDAKDIMKGKFSQMIEHYIEDTDNFLEDITNALDTGDIKTIILSAHSIKSSSQQTGALYVSNIAAEMEETATEGKGSKEELQKMFEELSLAYKTILPEYKDIIEKNN